MASLQLKEVLRTVERRYRVGPIDAARPPARPWSAPTALAIAIEDARVALAEHRTPSPATRHAFLDALARLIDGVLQTGTDAAFQAMVLRDRSPAVREYASIAAHAEQDRRTVFTLVHAVAHPQKLARMQDTALKAALSGLLDACEHAQWPRVAEMAGALRCHDHVVAGSPPHLSLTKLDESEALPRLQRLAQLAERDDVQHYRARCAGQGPRSGSREAAVLGTAAQNRGAAVEAHAARAMQALADRLNEATPDATGVSTPVLPWRVVTSLRVPSSLPGEADRANTEWDVVLLQQAVTRHPEPAWAIRVLVEAKASPDAATADFLRLQRGIQLFASADPALTYRFSSHEGVVCITGASLRSLGETASLGDPDASRAAQTDVVLYCANAPVDAHPRLLNATSRMQLLCAPASLALASQIVAGQPAHADLLAPVWDALLNDPRFRNVLAQYPTLCHVREMMVHPDDLLAAVACPSRVRPGAA